MVSFQNIAFSHNLGNDNNKLAKTWKYHKIQDKYKWEVDSFITSPFNFHKDFDWINRESATKRLKKFHSDSKIASKQPITCIT